MTPSPPSTEFTGNWIIILIEYLLNPGLCQEPGFLQPTGHIVPDSMVPSGLETLVFLYHSWGMRIVGELEDSAPGVHLSARVTMPRCLLSTRPGNGEQHALSQDLPSHGGKLSLTTYLPLQEALISPPTPGENSLWTVTEGNPFRQVHHPLRTKGWQKWFGIGTAWK